MQILYLSHALCQVEEEKKSQTENKKTVHCNKRGKPSKPDSVIHRYYEPRMTCLSP